ncbi:MAG: hypothetical protein KAI55_00780 [Candidatus Aenigmarchaeota archaeon]|nr:hypothetical protein [Candidatus Aenigmarchaeota archaeon]
MKIKKYLILVGLIILLVLASGCINNTMDLKKQESSANQALQNYGISIYPNAEYSIESTDFNFYEEEHEFCVVYFTDNDPQKVVSFFEKQTKIITDYSDFVDKKANPFSTDVETGWTIPFHGKEFTFKNGNKIFITSLEVTIISPFSKKIPIEEKYANYKTQIIIEKNKEEFVEEQLNRWKEFDESQN